MVGETEKMCKLQAKRIKDNYMRDMLKKIFLKGILFFFSLEENPISQYMEEMKKKSDADRIAEDWINVGNDLKKVLKGQQGNVE